jgi:hypothetical protein
VRLDLTDLFVFASPESPVKRVLIFDANPFMTASDFHPEAVYRLNVDYDGDTGRRFVLVRVLGSTGSTRTATDHGETVRRAADHRSDRRRNRRLPPQRRLDSARRGQFGVARVP